MLLVQEIVLKIDTAYMLNNGADLSAVSKMLGHSTPTLTANTYLQYLKGAKEKAISLLPDLPLKPSQHGQ